MEGIGAQLHAARARWNLTLREVEERSSLLAQQWGNPSFKISASWLDRVERENRELSAAKLIVLAYVYGLTTDQMLALCQGPSQSPAQLEQISSPNSTPLLLQGPLEQHARLWLPDTLVTDQPLSFPPVFSMTTTLKPTFCPRLGRCLSGLLPGTRYRSGCTENSAAACPGTRSGIFGPCLGLCSMPRRWMS
jgi:transcriptional regulator with XRE-family HTH domain